MAADLYQVLNISKDATQEDIKKAFKKLAVEYHPDKNKGCKEKEEKFKDINQAYSVLSDHIQRENYDRFGTIDGTPQPQPDMNDFLRDMFGGIGGFQQGFAFPFEQRRPQPSKQDLVEVQIDICDLYYGNNKRVEFELLELCQACNGTGASSPSQIVNCITCKGQGQVYQQIGPFLNRMSCPSCAGAGKAIKSPCTTCKAQKTVYTKKIFDLKLPKGVPNNHEVRMHGRGSYSAQLNQNKDMVFKFKHEIKAPYELDDNMNVILTIPITIEELIGGFQKTVELYKEEVVFACQHYFNPNNLIVLKEKGIFNMNKNTTTDLMLKFKVEFVESDKLVKLHKVFNMNKNSTNKDTINILENI